MITEFSKLTVEQLKDYVYVLTDENDKFVYIGKGTGQRVFESINQRSKEAACPLKGYIVRYGLSDEQAFDIEATLINFVRYFKLATLKNAVEGHDTDEFGLSTVEDIDFRFNAGEIKKEDFKHKVLLITVRPQLDTVKDPQRLYERCRADWYVDKARAEKADYVMAVYNGVIRGIYKPNEWVAYPPRGKQPQNTYGFSGSIVEDEEILALYLNKAFKKTKAAQNPLKYINI